MSDFRTIVLTTDFSETSKEAFEAARTVAEKFGGKLLFLYVDEERLPPFIGEFPGVNGISSVEILESHRKRATEELQRLARGALGDRVPVETFILPGTPHKEIVEFAEKHQADLIVMATHGRGFISHALMGSTTERVIRHAPCPVLAVRCVRSGD